MKKHLLGAFLLVIGGAVQLQAAIASVKYKLTYNSTLSRYEAYAVSNVSGTFHEQTSQFTIVSDNNAVQSIAVTDNPLGSLNIWGLLQNTFDNGNPANPVNAAGTYTGNRYFLVNCVTGQDEIFVANVPKMLFSFTMAGGCDPSIRIWKNGVDPTSSQLTGGGDYHNVFNQADEDLGFATVDGYVSNLSPRNVGCPITISGSVFDDANSDKAKNGTEVNINGLTSTGVPQFANLINEDGNVIASVAVDAMGMYAFTDVPSGVDGIKVQLSSTPGVIGLPMVTATIPTMWLNTGTNIGSFNPNGNNASQTGQPSSVILVNTYTTNITNQNFGVQMKPYSDAKTFVNVPQTAFTSTPSILINGKGSFSIVSNSAALNNNTAGTGNTLSGTDFEDCSTAHSCITNRTFEIKSINANTRLRYNNADVVVGQASAHITSFDPSKLVIYGQVASGGSAAPIGFTYTMFDNSGQESNASVYSITSVTPLPVKLTEITASAVGCSVEVAWETAVELSADRFDVERSNDGREWKTLGSVKAINPDGGKYTFTDASPVAGANQYRLKMVDLNGTADYSQVRTANSDCGGRGDVLVYPTEVNGDVFISLPKGDEAAQVMLLNNVGQLISNKANNAGAQVQSFSMESLPAGQYLVRVVTATEAKTFKVIKK